jgi:hypothetical protein
MPSLQLEMALQKQAALAHEVHNLKLHVFRMHETLSKLNTDQAAAAVAYSANLQRLEQRLEEISTSAGASSGTAAGDVSSQRESLVGPDRTSRASSASPEKAKDGTPIRAVRKRDPEVTTCCHGALHMLITCQIIVHKKMLHMIGITYEKENQRITVPEVPEGPLVAPPVGDTESSGSHWTPDWTKGITFKYNAAFIQRVLDLILADEHHKTEDSVS